MKLSIGLLAIPLLMFGQGAPKPPAGVEEALVARVNAFYQNFVDGSPRKAEAFVAEDTKDWYYNAEKLHFQSFKVEKVTFSDNFTKATVVVVGKAVRNMAGQSVVMDMPQDTHWKIEDGKWVWTYHPEDYCLTPMCGAVPPKADGAVPPPKDLTPAEIQKRGEAILKEMTMGLDKARVVLRTDQVSDAKVVFTNGSVGHLQVGLNAPIVRGLKAQFDRVLVPGHEQAVLTLHFDPSDKSGPADAYIPKGDIRFRVVILPFDREFPLTVSFVDGK